MSYSIKVEYAHERKIRERNKRVYRLAHWPIWIWVFFIAPGPLTFDLFSGAAGFRNLLWLFLVLMGTGVAGWFGQLPGVEPRPYILRFSEDKPNPLYRRICYTFAWNALINFALLNLSGLVLAVALRKWYLRQIYTMAYLPLLTMMLLFGWIGALPRVGKSTLREGTERRYFYGTVWSVSFAQIVLFLTWKLLSRTYLADVIKLSTFILTLAGIALMSALGLLPRTRPILPGEVVVAD